MIKLIPKQWIGRSFASKIGACFFPVLLVVSSLFAQPSLQHLREASVLSEGADAFKVTMKDDQHFIATVKMNSASRLSPGQVPDWLSEKMRFRDQQDEFRPTGKNTRTKQHWLIQRFQQYYRGIRVEAGALNILSYNGQVKVMQTEFYPVPDGMVIRPVIDAQSAREIAKRQIGAQVYAGETDSAARALPSAELVILYTREREGHFYLAYRERIAAIQPASYQDVFVSAVDGRVLQVRNLQHQPVNRVSDHTRRTGTDSGNMGSDDKSRSVKSPNTVPAAQVNASGNTRYSGFQQDFITDDEGIVSGRPYQLRATQYNFLHDIITLNYGGRRTDNTSAEAAATDFIDNDNVWMEYQDADRYTLSHTLSGVDAHFHMQIISDYWLNRHGRNSWDDEGSEIKSYVHATLVFGPSPGTVDNDNAFWSSHNKAMYFGDGSFARNKPTGLFPLTALDVSGHELGHAVCDMHVNGGLAYQAESGALNEAFSDIWSACIENYYNERFSASAPKNVWLIGEEFDPAGNGFRNFRNPKSSDNPAPDTYNAGPWASTAPNAPPFGTGQGEYDNRNDYGGVHTNSSVLLKWFSLIVDGGSGTNDLSVDYNITSIGFRKGEILAYMFQGMLTQYSTYEDARNVSLAVAESIIGNDEDHPLTEDNVRQIRKAWIAVGLGHNLQVYDQQNTPVFTTSSFTSITVGKDGYVWAGTDQNGLYLFNGAEWKRSPNAVSTYQINDLKSDKSGGVWIAQSGRGFDNFNAGGGVHYFPDTVFTGFRFYDDNDGLASRFVSSLLIDTASNAAFPRVKAAERFMLNVNSSSDYKSGKVSVMNSDGSAFFTIPDPSGDNGVDGFSAIGGNHNETWAFRTLTQEIHRYNTANSFTGTFNEDSVTGLPGEMAFYVNAIYFDKNNNRWLGLADSNYTSATTGGAAVFSSALSAWQVLPESVLPRPANVFKNAISGDASGKVFIGTDSGLVIYKGIGSFTDPNSYTRISVKEGLPTSKIRAVAYDTIRGGVWMATQKGVVFCKLADNRSILVSVLQRNCPPGIFDVSFTVNGSFYNKPIPNKFVVELSDPNGDFSNPLPLATVNAAPYSGGTFTINNLQIPPNAPLGKAYTVSVKSNNPKLAGFSPAMRISKPVFATTPNQSRFASYDCVDGDWTHYYDDNGTGLNIHDDILLISLKKNGNNIGVLNSSLFVKVATTAAGGTFSGSQITGPQVLIPFWSMNRFWDVSVTDTAFQPDNLVTVRFYYTDQDIYDVNGVQPGNPVDHKKLVFYKTDGNPDPSTNLAGNTVIRSYVHENGFPLPGYTWKHTDLGNGFHMAEFEVSSFSGGGGGVSLTGGSFTSLRAVSVANGNWSNPATWSTGVVPDQNTDVEISHAVQVDIPGAQCRTLTQKPPAVVTVLSGNHLTIRQ